MRHIELFVVNGKIELGCEYQGNELIIIRPGRITDSKPAILTINDEGSIVGIKNLSSDQFFACKLFSDDGYDAIATGK